MQELQVDEKHSYIPMTEFNKAQKNLEQWKGNNIFTKDDPSEYEVGGKPKKSKGGWAIT